MALIRGILKQTYSGPHGAYRASERKQPIPEELARELAASGAFEPDEPIPPKKSDPKK